MYKLLLLQLVDYLFNDVITDIINVNLLTIISCHAKTERNVIPANIDNIYLEQKGHAYNITFLRPKREYNFILHPKREYNFWPSAKREYNFWPSAKREYNFSLRPNGNTTVGLRPSGNTTFGLRPNGNTTHTKLGGGVIRVICAPPNGYLGPFLTKYLGRWWEGVPLAGILFLKKIFL